MGSWLAEGGLTTFDPSTHTYRWDGQVVPSVTQILQETGYISDFCKRGKQYTDRGNDIHRMIQLANNEDREFGEEFEYQALVESYPHESKQWSDFLATSGFKILGAEIPTYGWLGFFPVGKPDWAGTLDLKAVTRSGEPAIVDMKTGASAPPHTKLQLAAYVLGEYPDDWKDVKRFSLALRKEGKTEKSSRFKLKPYEDMEDFDTWRKEVKRYYRNLKQM